MSACTSPSRSSRRTRTARSGQSIRRVLTTAKFLVAVSVAALSAQAKPQTEATKVMQQLSERFRTLELDVREGNLVHAEALANEIRALARSEPVARLGAGELAGDVARLEAAAGELADLAARGNLVGCGQEFEELRSACVTCHVRARSDNDVRGIFPARDATVVGVVTLADVDGRPRDSSAWVLVFLERATSEPRFVHARSNPRISQSGRRFEPRVLPVLVGAEVEFPNDDTIFHNVFSLSRAAPFDLGVYEPGRSASVRMERTGLVKVYCNIHPEMSASIVVLENPWYALTDSAGRFVLCGVQDGDYQLRAWNDMGAEARRELQVRGAHVLEVALDLRETKRVLTHTNKYGGAYSGKYR